MDYCGWCAFFHSGQNSSKIGVVASPCTFRARTVVRRGQPEVCNATKQIAKVEEMALAGLLGRCWGFSRTRHTRAHTNTGSHTSDKERRSERVTHSTGSFNSTVSTVDTPSGTQQGHRLLQRLAGKRRGRSGGRWAKTFAKTRVSG